MNKSRRIKFKLRRTFRKSRRQVEDLSLAADETVNRHFFRRLTRFTQVRRFVFSWIALILLLILVITLQFGFLKNQFEYKVFVPGGIFTEGVIGKYSNINPIYANGSVDNSVSKLVFSGLFKYSADGELIPDLAEKIEQDSSERIYTVTLKDNIYWHDGKQVTANDVAFTFNTIKDPDVKSYLFESWQGIKIEAVNDKLVKFTLKNNFGPFAHSLTTGIIPEHVLKDVPAIQLRSNDFNTIKPVGSGPFILDSVEVEAVGSDKTQQETKQLIGLSSFDNYYYGAPKLNKFIVKTFQNQEELERAYVEKKINAFGQFAGISEEVSKDYKTLDFSTPISAETMVFFKTSSGVLKDQNVREALALATNKPDIMNSLGYPIGLIDQPILNNQLGYDKKFAQKTNNPKKANNILDKSKWKINPNTGIRQKGNQPLQFKIYAEKRDEYITIVQNLQNQWKQIGADVTASFQEQDEIKNTIANHDYEALLNTISIGADPDVFAFWHSSQADPRSTTRLNFSEYKSSVADEALKSARSRTDPVLRSVKYKPFLAAWAKDNPAIALFQPRYVFIVRSPFEGFDNTVVVNPVDRYSEVQNWAVKQEKVSE